MICLYHLKCNDYEKWREESAKASWLRFKTFFFLFYNFIKNCETCCCSNYCRTVAGDSVQFVSRLRLKCDGTRAETIFRLSAKRTSPFISAGASVQSTTSSPGVRISGSNAGYTMFRGSVKGTGYPLHSPVSPSLPLPCVTVCHHISTGLYLSTFTQEPAVSIFWVRTMESVGTVPLKSR